jgi:hypothetical protein
VRLHKLHELAERSARAIGAEHFHFLAGAEILNRAGVDVRQFFGLPEIVPVARGEIIGGVGAAVLRGDDAGLVAREFNRLHFGLDRLLQIASCVECGRESRAATVFVKPSRVEKVNELVRRDVGRLDVLVVDGADKDLVFVGSPELVKHDPADVGIRIDQSIVGRADAIGLDGLELEHLPIAHDDKPAIAIAQDSSDGKLNECREVVPAQEIALLAPLDPVAFNLIVEFLVARACLVGNATCNIGCEFEEEGSNRREIVGKITGSADELVSFRCACGVFRSS